MNLQLSVQLIKYRDITLELISSVENENYDFLDDLLNHRETVILDINTLKYTEEEFKAACQELKILFLQDNLNKLINYKKDKVRHELDSLSSNKSAQKSYNKNFSVDSIFFNKKI
jgi:hypothetical protein